MTDDHRSEVLGYAAPGARRPDRRSDVVAIAQVVLTFIGITGLFVGFVIHGVAMGDVGDEPNHLMVGVGRSAMICAAALLALVWWLPRRRAHR